MKSSEQQARLPGMRHDRVNPNRMGAAAQQRQRHRTLGMSETRGKSKRECVVCVGDTKHETDTGAGDSLPDWSAAARPLRSAHHHIWNSIGNISVAPVGPVHSLGTWHSACPILKRNRQILLVGHQAQSSDRVIEPHASSALTLAAAPSADSSHPTHTPREAAELGST